MSPLLNIEDYRAEARHFLARFVFVYIDGPAEDQVCFWRNRRDIEALTLHSRRQLEPAPSIIGVLARLVDSAVDRLAALVDSGFFGGRHIENALALGIRAVFVGRAAWGLAVGGESTTSKAPRVLSDELCRQRAFLKTDCLHAIGRGPVHSTTGHERNHV